MSLSWSTTRRSPDLCYARLFWHETLAGFLFLIYLTSLWFRGYLWFHCVCRYPLGLLSLLIARLCLSPLISYFHRWPDYMTNHDLKDEAITSSYITELSIPCHLTSDIGNMFTSILCASILPFALPDSAVNVVPVLLAGMSTYVKLSDTFWTVYDCRKNRNMLISLRLVHKAYNFAVSSLVIYNINANSVFHIVDKYIRIYASVSNG